MGWGGDGTHSDREVLPETPGMVTDSGVQNKVLQWNIPEKSLVGCGKSFSGLQNVSKFLLGWEGMGPKLSGDFACGCDPRELSCHCHGCC